jgi:hypothetical protein
MAETKDVRFGTTQVDKIYCGTDLVYEKNPIDTTPPITTVYPNNHVAEPTYVYSAGTKFWLEVNEACLTYFTLDGSEPTTSSALFREPFILDADTTVKYFSVDMAGNVETVKTTVLNIQEPVANNWRYLKIEGYGSVEEPATTRTVEFEAWEGATNRMSGATILSGDTPNNAGTLAQIKDGVKSSTSNTYPLWWTATPNGNIVIDLLAERTLTKLNYYAYSITSVQRANRFKILASNTNNGTDWVSIWDMSGNTTPQPILPSGFEKIL